MNKLCTVIMAGGKGTRLWPESTEKKPKQYLSLFNNKPLLTKTLERFDGVVETKNRYVVTTKDQSDLAIAASKGIANDDGIIYEPSGRNTAPCILLSIAFLEAKGVSEDTVVAVMPSDHVILNTKGFQDSFLNAAHLCAETNTITTIGITPNFPHTGYGYIHTGEDIGAGKKVTEFKEKPSYDVAKSYLESGQYLWNAGMFMATLSCFKEQFSKYSPDIYKSYGQLVEAISNGESIDSIYSEIPKDSIDYAIMEKSEAITTIPASFDWNDLGSWEAMEAVFSEKDENTFVSENEAYFLEGAKGNIVYAPNKFVSLIDVKDLVVVANDDVLMVVPKDQSQKVKHVVSHLKESKLNNLL